MTSHCNECKKKAQGPFTPKVIEILNEAQPVLFYRVDYPAELGDDTTLNVEELNYKNVLLYFESNKHAYLYSSDGIPTRISVEPIDIDYILEELERLGVEVKNLDEKVDQHYREFEELNEFTHLEVDNLRDTTGDLQRNLEQEVADRQEADEAVKSEIGANITNLQNDVQAEATARKEADDELQSQIDAIESKSDVVDVVDTYADLESYNTSALGDNDVVKVLQDETHDGAISYYRWDKTAGTWNYVGSVGPYYTKAETDEKITEAMGNVEIPVRAKNLPSVVETSWSIYTRTEDEIRLRQNYQNLDTGAESSSIGTWLRAATSTEAGVMSAADKRNLDALVEGGGGSSVELLSEYMASPTETQAYGAKYINGKLNASTVEIGQNAKVTSYGVAIGEGTTSSGGDTSIVIGGQSAAANAAQSIAIGRKAIASHKASVALGSNTSTTRDYEVSIGDASASSSSNFKTRLLANVRAGELDTDAVNKKQMEDYVAEHGGGGGGEVPERAKNLPRYVVSETNISRGYTITYNTSADSITTSLFFTDLQGGSGGGYNQNSKLSRATSTQAGVMAAEDKTNLDNVVAAVGDIAAVLARLSDGAGV